MILQALCDYYDRKQDDLPPFGFEEKAIPFIVVIDEAGQFIQLDDNREIEDGKTTIKPVRVPKASGRSGAKSYETAYCLWDHYGYIAAQPKLAKPADTPKEKEIEDAKKQHRSFKNLVSNLSSELSEDSGVKAVDLFLNSENEVEKLKAHETWKECLKIKGCNLTFRLSGNSHLVCQSQQVINWVERQALPESSVHDGFCLITGKKSKIVRLHDSVSGVNQKPAPLAAINEPAYTSFGKDKGFNFPVSAESSFKYAATLNYLLRKSSQTKFRIGETSYVCWSDKNNALENTLVSIFTDAKDDPDATTQAVKSLFSTIHNGAYIENDGNDKFFVLGLAPNSARIVVRYWQVDTIAEFSEKIAQWFNDIDISGRDHSGYPPLKKLLRTTALQYKDDNISPNLPADVIRSILTGTRLPDTFLQATLRRVRAEQGKVSFNRACIIKACLNRKYRFSTTKQRELTVSLNKEEKRPGYCLGRLFAVLEKLQADAQPGINATIRDRYYSSASCTPKSVFGTLMRLSTHHLKKLENPGWRINAEKRIGEVMGCISEFPSHLNLENQGLFAIGYYHQKQDFYTKNLDKGE
ncbi:type I-C CRISPR-associated protein Cas8c/Csd1 [sulfur-oxidizing endosymbiont of Gigantopelta aegis]|uniref:type I-C CRISPR-associated protein Cas8c/Csd1 n=1 Tax=sulfur-oxidizing endosymbiont of Gigantopelta aegis TaxID=2794934 RepID=UPI0018DE678A|nr:type I-C CRISPR-associated protein Cas8c/Csd1 [sulfur-oxidizing endosymbiont of Gigantopelta aegis]